MLRLYASMYRLLQYHVTQYTIVYDRLHVLFYVHLRCYTVLYQDYSKSDLFTGPHVATTIPLYARPLFFARVARSDCFLILSASFAARYMDLHAHSQHNHVRAVTNMSRQDAYLFCSHLACLILVRLFNSIVSLAGARD